MSTSTIFEHLLDRCLVSSHLTDAAWIVVIHAEALIRRYVMEHDAELVEWDPRSCGIRYLVPVGARRTALREWSATLSPAG